VIHLHAFKSAQIGGGGGGQDNMTTSPSCLDGLGTTIPHALCPSNTSEMVLIDPTPFATHRRHYRFNPPPFPSVCGAAVTRFICRETNWHWTTIT